MELRAESPLMSNSAREAFEKGLELFREGRLLAALGQFERSFSLDNSNVVCESYIALLIASERGQLQKAFTICEEAIKKSPDEPLLYLNLGRLYIRAGRRGEAIDTIRKGLGIRHMPEGVAILDSLGTRQPPVFRFLSRGHFLNKYAGMLLKRLGFR